MKHITLRNWTYLQSSVINELKLINYKDNLVTRNFQIVTFNGEKEFDRLDLAKKTGTDRDANSPFWNVTDFDYDHDMLPAGKKPNEIIYAFTVNPFSSPWQVMNNKHLSTLDYSNDLNEHDGLILYNTNELEQKSNNEYWFKTTPANAALLIYSIDH